MGQGVGVGILFSDIYCGNLVELQEINLTVLWSSPPTPP